MSTFTCEIIGTGDGKLENLEKTHSPPSTSMVKGIVEDIVENALDILEDSAPREKSSRFFGTGDRKSDEEIEKKISCYFPHVEKKTRLTDLVRNSKQILQKMMMSESKITMQEQERKAEEQQEKLIQAIDLDCIQLSHVQHKIKTSVAPEEVDLPKNDSASILNPFVTHSNDESDTESYSGIIKKAQSNKEALEEMVQSDVETFNEHDNVELNSKHSKSNEENLAKTSKMIEIELNKSTTKETPVVENHIELNISQESDSPIKINQSEIIEIKLDDAKDSDPGTGSIAKRLMTLPRVTTSKAKAALTSKCRTLKREASTLKKKKWNVSSRIANFFRKKRANKKLQGEEEIKEI